MENLHLTYREVVYEIPYRNLVLMQRDKLHTVTGIKVNKVRVRIWPHAEEETKNRHGKNL